MLLRPRPLTLGSLRRWLPSPAFGYSVPRDAPAPHPVQDAADALRRVSTAITRSPMRTWVSVAAFAALAALGLAYRVVQDTYSHSGEEPLPYFEPYHPGYVGIFGDPTQPRRWRVNEGNQFMNARPNIYDGVHERRKCS